MPLCGSLSVRSPELLVYVPKCRSSKTVDLGLGVLCEQRQLRHCLGINVVGFMIRREFPVPLVRYLRKIFQGRRGSIWSVPPPNVVEAFLWTCRERFHRPHTIRPVNRRRERVDSYTFISGNKLNGMSRSSFILGWFLTLSFQWRFHFEGDKLQLFSQGTTGLSQDVHGYPDPGKGKKRGIGDHP